MQEIRLYHGDNGVQEFYEDAASQTCLMRVHGEQSWFFLRLMGETCPDDPVGTIPGVRYRLIGGRTIEEAIRRVVELHRVRIIIDPSREFILPAEEGFATMPLVAV